MWEGLGGAMGLGGSREWNSPAGRRVTHPLRLVWLAPEPWTSLQVGAGPSRSRRGKDGSWGTGQERMQLSWNQVTHLFFTLCGL